MKRNSPHLLAAGLCVAGLVICIFHADAQVTLSFDSVSPVEDLTLQGGGTFSFGPSEVAAGIYNLTVDGVATPSFCIDVFRDAPTTTLTDYNYTSLSLAPLAPAGPMGLIGATDIEKLWAAYFPAATANGQDAAALQVAIWEDVAAKVGTYTVTFSDNNAVTTEAAAMLASLPGLTAQANLVGLISPDGQNYVVPVPAPEPTTTGCLLVGLVVFGCFQRLKIGRRI
ncbi:MAG TPA: hypothetical protein VHY30_03885 [Verrucomicrobiae bacterium]|jgi:hypothetical protein|nr:hypothetical protein [Verrucomicrobiae bacterium]